MAMCKACGDQRHEQCEDVYDENTKKPRERDYRGCPCQHKKNTKPQESALPG